MRRSDSSVKAVLHDFVLGRLPPRSPCSDDDFCAALNSAAGPWEMEIDADGRDAHYDAAGVSRPLRTLFACDFDCQRHRAAFTVLRSRRQLPRRGQLPDHHLPRAYKLGGVDEWRYVEAYRAWLDGGVAALDGWRPPWGRVGDLNEFLRCNLVLPSCDGEGLRRAQQFERDGGFDVCAAHEERTHALLCLGWPAGEAPQAPRLVYAIVDRLEYECARDLADEAGEAGDFLLGTGAWTEEARAVEFARTLTALAEADHARDISSAMGMNAARHDAA